jgi:hypothetical protein
MKSPIIGQIWELDREIKAFPVGTIQGKHPMKIERLLSGTRCVLVNILPEALIPGSDWYVINVWGTSYECNKLLESGHLLKEII